MQKILGYMRKAIKEFDMIHDGDRICVGISGGKDSLILLTGLHQLRRFIGISYDIVAVTIDPGLKGIETDFSPVQRLCDEYGIEYHVVETRIGEIVFDVRKESNPCSLCAKMRRGALHDATVRFGCNKIALGHNMDDVIETFMMNLFTVGNISCFEPVSYLDMKDITLIRPLALAPEREIIKAAKKYELPVVKSKCPEDGHTNRQTMKGFLAERERSDHGFKNRIFGAIRRSNLNGWGGVDYVPKQKKK